MKTERIENKELIEAAKQMPCYGIVRRSAAGFIYLEISKSFEKLASFLHEPSLFPPPDIAHIGMHISVILADETEGGPIGFFPEVRKIIYFVPLHLCQVTMLPGESKYEEWGNVRKVWLLEVYCPLVEQLRMRYGLSPKIKDHEFHITFAVQEF